jgi:flagellin
MVALQTLADINNQLTDTNNRVSTGLKIAEARDSAAYWAIATTTKSDNGALETVQEALSLGEATMDVMYNGLESVRESLQQMKELLVAARQPGVDRAAIQEQIDGLVTDMQNKAQASVINEQNFLEVTSGGTYNQTRSIVASFERLGDNITVSTIDIDIDNIKLIDNNDNSGILDNDYTGSNGLADSVVDVDIATISDSQTDLQELEDWIEIVDNALTQTIDAQNLVGTVLSRAESQNAFISALIDANDRAVGALVDANMEVESTKLRALQTQQQLSVQSLTIANQSASNILSLFR